MGCPASRTLTLALVLIHPLTLLLNHFVFNRTLLAAYRGSPDTLSANESYVHWPAAILQGGGQVCGPSLTTEMHPTGPSHVPQCQLCPAVAQSSLLLMPLPGKGWLGVATQPEAVPNRAWHQAETLVQLGASDWLNYIFVLSFSSCALPELLVYLRAAHLLFFQPGLIAPRCAVFAIFIFYRLCYFLFLFFLVPFRCLAGYRSHLPGRSHKSAAQLPGRAAQPIPPPRCCCSGGCRPCPSAGCDPGARVPPARRAGNDTALVGARLLADRAPGAATLG